MQYNNPEEVHMAFSLKKGVVYLLFFIFSSWSTALSSLADEDKEKDKGSEREVLLRLGDWEFDAGGQVRLRGDFAWNQNLTNFAFTPGHKEAQFLERTRLQASIENHSLNLQVFVQGQWYGRWGGIDNRSDFDLYQGYVEWGKVLNLPVSLKAGRQEFLYGSAYFLGTNDSYNGLSWDGFKTSIRPFEELVVDILGSKMAKLNSGDPDIYLAGLYTTYKIYKEGSLEGYLFYNKGGFPISHREFVLNDSGQQWFTVGARLAGKLGRFDFELEPEFQWGKVQKVAGDGRDLIRAYGGHLDLGYTFKLPWEPRVFGTYAYGSGDNNPFYGRYTEFHNIFNDDDNLYGKMKVIPDQSGVTVNDIHASGLQIWVGGISLNPLPKLGVTLRAHRFLANRVPSGFNKDIGTEFDSEISYKLTKRISFLVGLDTFLTGRFFRQASGSGKDIEYAYVQAQVEF
jgi:hypothetical protein